MSPKQKKNTAKYLEQYAEAQALSAIELAKDIRRSYALVVPAYKESTRFIERLSRHTDAANTLLIVVLNEPETKPSPSHRDAFMADLERISGKVFGPCHLTLCNVNQLQCLLVDQTNERALPEKSGVGLARKIGTDIAISLISADSIRQPWVFSSDADCHLPPNYFESIRDKEANTSALVFNFQHIGSKGPELEATLIYEACIKYYQSSLKAAGSPYAFNTLGSCLAVSAAHYCSVRGFPKKAAGEDFYLLNKLAKVGDVQSLLNTTVEIESRYSDRVPFGTGPAAARIAQQLANNEPILYYNPTVFSELNSVLTAIPAIWENPQSALEALSKPAAQALTEAGLLEFTEKRYRQDKSLEQYKISFNAWFDAFRTLKFIHNIASSYKPVPFPPA